MLFLDYYPVSPHGRNHREGSEAMYLTTEIRILVKTIEISFIRFRTKDDMQLFDKQGEDHIRKDQLALLTRIHSEHSESV